MLLYAIIRFAVDPGQDHSPTDFVTATIVYHQRTIFFIADAIDTGLTCRTSYLHAITMNLQCIDAKQIRQ